MRTLLIMAFMALSLVACKEKDTKTDEPKAPTQMEEVMAVHDEMMSKMSVIGEYIGRLESQIDTTNVDSMKIQTVAELKAANQSMMDWMKEFGNAFTSEEILEGAELSEEKKTTLDEFQKSANAMKEQMLKAIENAEKALQ